MSSDKKFRQLQFEIIKKRKLAEENFIGGEYVDVYRNISVSAAGETDLSKDLEEKGLVKENGGGPSLQMFLVEAKSQIRKRQMTNALNSLKMALVFEQNNVGVTTRKSDDTNIEVLITLGNTLLSLGDFRQSLRFDLQGLSSYATNHLTFRYLRVADSILRKRPSCIQSCSAKSGFFF